MVTYPDVLYCWCNGNLSLMFCIVGAMEISSNIRGALRLHQPSNAGLRYLNSKFHIDEVQLLFESHICTILRYSGCIVHVKHKFLFSFYEF